MRTEQEIDKMIQALSDEAAKYAKRADAAVNSGALDEVERNYSLYRKYFWTREALYWVRSVNRQSLLGLGV